jgi:hypothetical protein
MDVNGSDYDSSVFRELSKGCDLKKGWQCSKTGYACKDYLCHRVKSAADIKEVRSNFAQHAK